MNIFNTFIINVNPNELIYKTTQMNSEMYILTIKSNGYLNLSVFDNSINNTKYVIYPYYTYHIILFLSPKYTLKITKTTKTNISTKDLNVFYIEKYGEPKKIHKSKYNVIYSFDKNYFVGGFASIHSLLFNFNKQKLNNLSLNIIIPDTDINYFNDKFLEMLVKINIIPDNIHLYVINNYLIDECFINTNCVKGGNHLLNIGNFSRLIIGHLIDINKILYLDADTIIQTDLSKCIDKFDKKNFDVCGTKSPLTYKNILNCNNYDKTYELLGKNFNINNNVIYTGTLFINPNSLKKHYTNIKNIVNFHNKQKGGLYKLFTMSIINLCFWNKLYYSDSYLKNIVDLGYKLNISETDLKNADVLDWSGMRKPWFKNGLYKQYWKKYNVIFDERKNIILNKNTVEMFK
jgi:lipopolysaccharide biosynthesis glycosyltransferase